MKHLIAIAAVSFAAAAQTSAPAAASDATVSLSPVVTVPAGTKLTDGRTLVEPLSSEREGAAKVRVVDSAGQESELQVDIRMSEASGELKASDN